MKITFLLFLLLASTAVKSQQLKATVADLLFMSGTWTQQHKWGDMEEYWGKPMGNCMTSTFRCVKDGRILFYEFVVIEEGVYAPVLTLRHFNPGSIGWEDKNSPLLFPLASLGKNIAIFEAGDKSLKMTYDATVKDSLHIILEEKNKTGLWTTTMFNMAAKKN